MSVTTVAARSPLRRLDEAWVAPGSAHAFAALRIAAAVALGLRLLLRDWAELSTSAAPFRPQGLVAWIPSMPAGMVLTAIQVAGLIGAGLAVAAATTPRCSRFGRPAFVVAWVALLVLAGVRDALHAKVLHNDVLMLLAFFPIAIAAGDARLGDTGRAIRWGWPRRLALAVVALVYVLTAYQKMRLSGLAWITSDNLRWVMVEAQISGRAPTTAVASWLVDHAWACHAMAGVTILTEFGAPLVLARKRLRPWFFVAAVALHGGIWLTIGVDYWGWIVTVGALVLPWERVFSGRASA